MSFYRRKIIEPILRQLKQGVTPQKLAASCAIALCVSVFPLPAVTTFICVAFAAAFKLNYPIIIAINYLMTVPHLVMMPMFMRAGESLFFLPHVGFHPVHVFQEFKADPWMTLSQYGTSALVGVFVWFIAAPVVGYILYRILLPILLRAKPQSII